VTAEEWAARLADAVAPAFPVNKAHGATTPRRDLVKMLRPAGRHLAALQERADGIGRQLEELAARDWGNWRPEGLAVPYPAGRVQPLMAGPRGPFLAPAGADGRLPGQEEG
jgi:hypothetical protein